MIVTITKWKEKHLFFSLAPLPFCKSLINTLTLNHKGQHLEQLQSNCECVDCPRNEELNIKDIFKAKETY